MNDFETLDLGQLPEDVAALTLLQLASPSEGLNLIVARFGRHGESYAIKEADFKYLQVALPMFGSLLATQVTAWAPGSIASLIVLYIDYRRKRIALSALQTAILKEIKETPGITIPDLQALLEFRNLDMEAIRVGLETLKAVRNEAGSLVELAKTDSQDRWYPCDV